MVYMYAVKHNYILGSILYINYQLLCTDYYLFIKY